MSTWRAVLARLDDILEQADRCLATSDLDGAAAALDELRDPSLRAGLPELTTDDAEGAARLAERLAAAETSVRSVLARLRPELGLLAGADVSARTTSRYLDEPA